ncbi:hypothetical protein MXB_3292, partial [Myxobolus squamalis]
IGQKISYKKNLLLEHYKDLSCHKCEKFKLSSTTGSNSSLYCMDVDYEEKLILCGGEGNKLFLFQLKNDDSAGIKPTSILKINSQVMSKIYCVHWYPWDNCMFTLNTCNPDLLLVYDTRNLLAKYFF